MKKWNLFSVLFIFLICFSACDNESEPNPDNNNENGNEQFNMNDGISSDVWDGTFDISWYDQNLNLFVISTPEQLAGVAKLVEAGSNFQGKTIALKNNIILNKKIEIDSNDSVVNVSELLLWTGIGTMKYEDSEMSKKSFRGTFDGNNYYVSGVYGNPLFNSCYSDMSTYATIKKLGIVSSYMYISQSAGPGYNTIGGIISHSRGNTIISQCYNMGIVKTEGLVGGIVGYMHNGINDYKGQVNNCFNTGKILSSKKNAYYFGTGGIVGYVSTSAGNKKIDIVNCYNIGTCNSSIVHIVNPYKKNDIAISNCFALKNVGSTEYAVLFDDDGILISGNNSGNKLIDILNASNDIWIVKPNVNNGFPIFK